MNAKAKWNHQKRLFLSYILNLIWQNKSLFVLKSFLLTTKQPLVSVNLCNQAVMLDINNRKYRVFSCSKITFLQLSFACKIKTRTATSSHLWSSFEVLEITIQLPLKFDLKRRKCTLCLMINSLLHTYSYFQYIPLNAFSFQNIVFKLCRFKSNIALFAFF